MNRTYLYAITDQPQAPLPATPGLAGGPLLTVTHQAIAAVISPIPAAHVPPTATNLWHHETVVETLMHDRAVLPVRFGTVLADEAAVHAALAAHSADFVANLQRVRGRVELALRVLWDEGEHPPSDELRQPSVTLPTSGRSYMLARLEEEHRLRAHRQDAEALVSAIDGVLAPLAVESTQRVLITPRLLLTAAYLVERDRVPAFRQEVEAIGAASPGLRFLCTGPWPAYSFVTAAAPPIQREAECLSTLQSLR